MQKTKHDIVIEYIESLEVGEKVSVRQLARQMNISEGTVYRAIKDAENQGLVSSIPKVGTIRIEQEKERSIDSLTYRELTNIVEGQLLHGTDKSDGAPKAFFVAGSVTLLWIYTVFAANRTLRVLYWSYPVTWTVTFLAHLVCFIVFFRRWKKRVEAR